jgi:hypothetical protein
MKTLRIESRVCSGQGFHRGVMAFGNLIQGFPFLNRIGRGEKEAGHKKNAGESNPRDSIQSHPSALAVRRKVADPFCQSVRAGRGLAKGPSGGRTEHLRQCSSAW